MNPLLKRLAALRLKVRILDGWLGICAVVGLIAGVGVSVGVLDYWAHLPSLARAVVLVGLLVGSGYMAFHYIIQPFLKPCDDLSLALRIEEVYPELNDALASTVQFLRQSPEENARVGGSADMREQTVQQTLAKAQTCDFGRILDRKSGVIFGAAACCALLVAGLVVTMQRQHAGTAFWRFVEPFGHHPWTQINVARLDGKAWLPIDPKKEDFIAKGQPYFIRIDLQGQIPKQAKIEIEGHIRADKVVELKLGEDKQSASFETGIDMTQQYQKFKFRVLANDGAFPPRGWHVVEVKPPPKLIDVQMTLHPPAYTDLASPVAMLPGTRHVELYAGTKVVLRAKADRPLEEAWLECRPENPAVVPGAALSFLGQTDPLQAVAQAAAGQAACGALPAEFTPERDAFSFSFMPQLSAGYILRLRDRYHLERQEPFDVKVLIDPLPQVQLVQPGSSVTRVPDANLTFKFRATDEFFAVKSVFVEYRRKNPDGTWIGGVGRNVLYEAKDFGKLLPALLAQHEVKAGGKVIPDLLAKVGRSGVSHPDMRLRYKQLDFEMVWSLRNQFKEGDLVVIEVCADDFCDIYGTREPGRSHAIELRIISRAKLVEEARDKLNDIQAHLKKVETMQKKALDAVNDARKQDKIDQNVRDRFTDEAEQNQRAVQEMIGNTPEQGLRREIIELRQLLRDNNETNSQPYRQTNPIKGTLDRIAQGELPQIEPKLNDARNDLANNDKNTEKTKKTLGDAAKLQGDVLKAIQELNRELDPGVKIQEQREQLRNLLDRQKKLQEEIEDAKIRKQDLDKVNPGDKVAEKFFRDELNKRANEQLDLSMQMDKLVKDMKAAQEQFDKNGDKANAKKLEQALEKLEPKKKDFEPKKKDNQKEKEKTPMPPEPKDQSNDTTKKKMRDVARDLQNKSEAQQQTLDKQSGIIEDIQQALNAIDGPKEDTTREEIQKRKDAEKKIDELANKLKQLQEETKNADKIEDKEERLKKKEELAKKHQELQDQIEKQARELARLQEHRAADELDEAAKNLQKAGQKLANDEDPQPQDKDAQKRLQQAKEELQQAEEELARELLIRMADQLKGLKERQDAAIQRTEDLHVKIMKKKSWTEGFLDTIDGNRDAQKVLADETDSFKEKLKEAKVFYSILERAKDSMDKAGAAMENRRELGKERRYIEKGDGELMDAKELKDEDDAQLETVKHQKDASKRLDRLLDAIKQELAKKPRKKAPEQAQDPNEEKKAPQQQGLRAADGIPPMAQLKALRAEQLDLNERTEDFARRHPDLTKLTDAQRMELRELEQEQERLQMLFSELVAPPLQKEGDQP